MAEQTAGKVPQIRFKGFEDKWDAEPLGDLFPITSAARVHKNEWTKSGVPFFRSSDVVSHFKGNENTKAFISHELYEELSAKVGRIKKGDMLVTGGGSIGIPYLVKTDEPLYFKDADLLWFKIREAVDSHYLYTFLSSEPFRRYLRSISHIGTIAHYTVEQAKSTPLRLPKNATEQTQIGEYFRELDSLIGLHQRKHDKLVTLKKAMLQKMFPQPGTTTPEIRFKGFSGDWAKEKLGAISESYSGGTPSVGNRSFYGGDIPFIRSAEINATSTELAITELGLRNSSAKMVEKGDVLYALYGATSGEVGISQINGAINQAILAITPHPGYSSKFLAIWLRNKKTLIVGTYIQGGQGNLSGNIVKSLEVDLPSSEEQQKIGTYFRTLDSLISKHATQLQKLQQLKSACLARMFV